jgi:pyruvate/2-oxoglutarate dehydrogenase complex dihydrolipoamide acyltransferase (E2) component
MSFAVVVPELGESVVEGTIANWLVKEGDRVEQDQPLVEITTDKVDVEIPSPVTGVIERIVVSEGEVVSIGEELARVDPDASARSDDSAATDSSGKSGSEPEARIDVSAPTESANPQSTLPTPPAPTREVEPETAAEVSSADATLPAGVTRYVRQAGDRVIPMTPLRRLVAEHMVYSKRTSPHVGTVAEIDMAGVVRVRERGKRAFRDAHGFSLSFLPFVVHATVRALLEFPRLNASVLGDAIVEKADLHIGVAVETDNGLIVPVVRHADRLSLTGLAQAVEGLASRARSKRLTADELQGGTFTISNPGRDGNLYGFAIINQPQVAILRMGEITKRPCVRTVGGEDALVIRPIMHLALSYDHRAVDGSPANGFLHRVRELLERAEFEL